VNAAFEVERVDAHLRGALDLLERRDTRALSFERRRERRRLVRELDRYRRARRFPQNRDFFGKLTPYFVDAGGTRCAMAHLAEVSGAPSLVERVRTTNNNARIRELATDAELLALLEESGLTVAEAARIQPGYSYTRTVDEPGTEVICGTSPGEPWSEAAFVGRIDGEVDAGAKTSRVLVETLYGAVSRFAASIVDVDRGAGNHAPGARVFALVGFTGKGPVTLSLASFADPVPIAKRVTMPLDAYVGVRLAGGKNGCVAKLRASFPDLAKPIGREYPCFSSQGCLGDDAALHAQGRTWTPPPVPAARLFALSIREKVPAALLGAKNGLSFVVREPLPAPTPEPPVSTAPAVSAVPAMSADMSPTSAPIASVAAPASIYVEPALSERPRHSPVVIGVAMAVAVTAGVGAYVLVRRRRSSSD
jgi:hypothetical protein